MKLWDAFLSVLGVRRRERIPEPSLTDLWDNWKGATEESLPLAEVAPEPSELDRVMDEHGLNPFDDADREYALDLLALRRYTDAHVSNWSKTIDGLLEAHAGQGWQARKPIPPDVQVMTTFAEVHAVVDDTAVWSLEDSHALRRLLDDELAASR